LKAVLLLAAMLILVPATLILSSCGGGGTGSNIVGPPRDNTPVVLQVNQPGIEVVADDRAVLDFSNAADGYISVLSYLEGIVVKVLVDVQSQGVQYQYTINNPGEYIIIPLSEGDGLYSVGVWQNTSGDQYSAVFAHEIDVILTDEFTPFLYPSQFVNFAYGDTSTTLSQQLVVGAVTDVDAINNIYRWVCENISYDMQKAATVASGYLPNNTNTIDTGEGICFDYAVLTASMLRAQRVPAKLVIGYAGTAYHAWMQVYSEESGMIFTYRFNGNDWVTMDPTFDAAAGGAVDLAQVIGDGSNYQPMFYY